MIIECVWRPQSCAVCICLDRRRLSGKRRVRCPCGGRATGSCERMVRSGNIVRRWFSRRGDRSPVSRGTHRHPRASGSGKRFLRVEEIGKRLDDWVITLGSVIDWLCFGKKVLGLFLEIWKDEGFWVVRKEERCERRENG